MAKDRQELEDSEIGAQIRRAAAERHITLLELGSRLGVSRPTIYAYASGTLRVPDKRLPKLATILGKSESYFRPRKAEDLDPSTEAKRALDLIEALLAPPSPSRALEVALDAAVTAPEAKNPVIRAEFLRRAGNARALAGDHLGALRNLDDALVAFEAADHREDAARCSQTLGLCFTALRRLEDAEVCFQRAARDLPIAEQWKGRSSLASLAESRGDYETAEQILSELLGDDSLGDMPVAYIRSNFASMTCARGFWNSGLSQSESALSAATEAGLTDQMVEMMISIARCHTHLGQHEEAWNMHVRAHDVATSIGDKARAAFNKVAWAQLKVRVSDTKAGKEDALSGIQEAVQHQFLRTESLGMLVLAEASLEQGQFEEAEVHARQAQGHAARHHYPVAGLLATTHRALAAAAQGRSAEAVASLNEVEDATAGLGEPKARLYAVRAVCHTLMGDSLAAAADRRAASETATACGCIIELPTSIAKILATV
ncbi:MAG: helix-turn-helix domain-containing protein [Fimbriimonadaceae bacterium]